MTPTKQQSAKARLSLPMLRFEIGEAARILRMSRASLYKRVHGGSIRLQKDGGRSYITRTELERYVEACNHRADQAPLGAIHR